jgi:hypothetical protein
MHDLSSEDWRSVLASRFVELVTSTTIGRNRGGRPRRRAHAASWSATSTGSLLAGAFGRDSTKAAAIAALGAGERASLATDAAINATEAASSPSVMPPLQPCALVRVIAQGDVPLTPLAERGDDDRERRRGRA